MKKPKLAPAEPDAAEAFRGLVERIDGGAAWLDSDGRILYVNRYLASLLRRPKAELEGAKFSAFVSGRDRELFGRLLADRRLARNAELDLRSGRTDVVPVLLRLERGTSGTTRLFAQDLRLPRRLESILLDGGVTRAILREIAEAVVLVDRDGVILRASPSARRLAGRNPVGRAFDEAFSLRASDKRSGVSSVPANLSTAIAQKEGFRGQMVFTGRDGRPRHVSVSSRPVPLQPGYDSGSVVVLTDISDAKNLEAELRRANESLKRRVEERTSRLLLLYDLARTSNEAESAEQALSLCLERVCRGGEWKFAQAYLRGGPPRRALALQTAWPPEELGPRGLAERLDACRRAPAPRDPLARAVDSGRLECSSRLARDLGPRGRAAARAGFRSVAAVPIRRGPEVHGVLELFSSREELPGDDARAALEAAGLQLGEVIDRKRLQREFAEAVSQEHETIGRELHDSVGQELTGLALMLRALPQREDAGVTDEITRGLQRVLREVHDLSRGVFPAELRNLGLAGGLSRLAQQTSKRSGFRVVFKDEAGVLPLDAQTCLQVFRIGQEAVNNAVKYSGGREVRLRLSRRGDLVELDVQDDGRGLPAKRDGLGGSGLRIMRFRAEAIGGALRLRRAPGGGTRITCRWKLDEATP